jgi:hypothetical protein
VPVDGAGGESRAIEGDLELKRIARRRLHLWRVLSRSFGRPRLRRLREKRGDSKG